MGQVMRMGNLIAGKLVTGLLAEFAIHGQLKGRGYERGIRGEDMIEEHEPFHT